MARKSSSKLRHEILSAPLHDILCGLLSGVSTSVILQPMDKALYLGMKNHRRFFHPANWQKPYHAMGQTLLYRAASHALYFPIEQWTRQYLAHSGLSNLIGGMLAGAVTSILLNPMSVIRYHCWLHHTSFNNELSNLWHGRGVRNFSTGLPSTLVRDVVFGGVFASTRHWNAFGYIDHNNYSYKQEFMWNGVCALIATTVSSPFNYIRNIQFSTPPDEKPESMMELMRNIVSGYKQCKGYQQKFVYLQIRFKFGWGTLRVGLGMALGSQTYEYLVRTI